MISDNESQKVRLFFFLALNWRETFETDSAERWLVGKRIVTIARENCDTKKGEKRKKPPNFSFFLSFFLSFFSFFSFFSLVRHAPVAGGVHGDGGLLPVVEDPSIRACYGGGSSPRHVAPVDGPRGQRRGDVGAHGGLNDLDGGVTTQGTLIAGEKREEKIS